MSLRLVVAAVLTTTLAEFARGQLVEALLPAIRLVLRLIDDQFIVLHLDTTTATLESAVRLRVQLARSLLINSNLIEPQPNGWLEVSIPLGTVLYPALVAIIVAAAWPSRRWGECIARLCFASLLGALLILVDTPVGLLASVWRLFVDTYDPGGSYLMLRYQDFMITGGRFALGAVAGVMATIGMGRALRAGNDHKRMASDSGFPHFRDTHPQSTRH